MGSRIEYLSVTFLEDVAFGPIVVPQGTTMSLQKDIARGLDRSLHINGPGSADTASFIGAGGGGAPVTITIVALDGGAPDSTFVLPPVDGGTPGGTAGSTVYDGGTP